MTPTEAIKHYGSQRALAEALGLKQPSISSWLSCGEIPYARQCQIEVVSGGALKADRPAEQAAA